MQIICDKIAKLANYATKIKVFFGSGVSEPTFLRARSNLCVYVVGHLNTPGNGMVYNSICYRC